mgnify:CR=1 FL=1
MKILFLGTPGFCLSFLNKIREGETDEVTAILTRPPKPAGRSYKIKESTLVLWARKNGIAVYTPEKVDQEFESQIRALSVDLGVVVAYGKILPLSFIQIFPRGCINIHFSLLPRYRGPAPIQRALMNGDKKTGVSVIFLSEKLDEGDVIVQKEVDIQEEDTAGTLQERLIEVGTELLGEAIELIRRGNPPRRRQDFTHASFAPAIKKSDAWIDWSLPARQIFNQVRAFYPWPGSVTTFRGKRLKILQARVYNSLNGDIRSESPSGEIVKPVKEKGFVVACGEGHLLVLGVQQENRSRVSAFSFWQGGRLKPGERLGKEE